MPKDLTVYYLFEQLFTAYPIVAVERMPNLTLQRAKMVIVSDLIAKTTDGITSKEALKIMCDITGFSMDVMPSLMVACKNAGVSLDFLQDYSRVQYLYENNSIAMNNLAMFIKKRKNKS